MLLVSLESTTQVPSKCHRLQKSTQSRLRFLYRSVALRLRPHLPLTLGRMYLISSNKHRKLQILATSLTQPLSSLEASVSSSPDRPVILQSLCTLSYRNSKHPSLTRDTINKTHHMFFLRLAAILVCTTRQTHAPCSPLRPVRASWVLLHYVLRRSILSFPSRCTPAQCRIHPPSLVQRWRRHTDPKHPALASPYGPALASPYGHVKTNGGR